MAQRKRAGPITQRSMDRNHPLLTGLFTSDCFRYGSDATELNRFSLNFIPTRIQEQKPSQFLHLPCLINKNS